MTGESECLEAHMVFESISKRIKKNALVLQVTVQIYNLLIYHWLKRGIEPKNAPFFVAKSSTCRTLMVKGIVILGDWIRNQRIALELMPIL